MAIVEHRDCQIWRALHADRRERAESHQHLAVAGHDEHATRGLGHCEAEPDHRRRTHRAPQIEITLVFAHRGGIPGRRTEAGHDQHVAPIVEQHSHRLAAIEARIVALRAAHFTHRLAPIRRWDKSTAVASEPLNAISKAAATVSPVSSARSTR